MTSVKRKKRTKIAWKPLLYGTLIGAAALVLSTLLLTLLIYLGWLPETEIPIGNTVIKILAALAAGGYIGPSPQRAPGDFGGVTAGFSLAASVAAMSVYLKTFRFTWSLAADLLMSFAIGSAAAALFLRRKKE